MLFRSQMTDNPLPGVVTDKPVSFRGTFANYTPTDNPLPGIMTSVPVTLPDTTQKNAPEGSPAAVSFAGTNTPAAPQTPATDQMAQNSGDLQDFLEKLGLNQPLAQQLMNGGSPDMAFPQTGPMQLGGKLDFNSLRQRLGQIPHIGLFRGGMV